MKSYSVLILFICLIVSACSESSTTTSSITEPTGSLMGTISLQDSLGNAIQDRRGAEVQIEGTSFSAITDSLGQWEIPALPTRLYTLLFSKPGFYTMKNMTYGYVTGKDVYYGNVLLQQEIHYSETLISLTLSSKFNQSKINFAFTNNTPKDIAVYYFFATTPNIDPNDSTTYRFCSGSSLSFFSSSRTGSIGLFTDVGQFFSSGQTVYLQAYPGGYQAVQHYFDPIKMRNIWVGFGKPSNVISAVMP